MKIQDRRYYRSPIRGGDPELLPFVTGGLSSLGHDQDCSPDGNYILYTGDGGPRSTVDSYTSSSDAEWQREIFFHPVNHVNPV